MEELDIWRTAQLLIKQHGEDAEIQAAMRADHALEQGHHEVELVWKRIGNVIKTLAQTAPVPGTPRH